MRFLSRLALAVVAVCGTFSCYRPAIMDGGFHCGDGGTCPDGYHCNLTDKHCYAGSDDGGPLPCSGAFPMPTPVCNDPAPTGPCNPACQSGCSCGRCTVSGMTTACTSVGPKKVSETCDVAMDDCAAGLGCIKDSCGVSLGRCRKFCKSNADCSGGTCNGSTTVSGVAVCELPPQACNPVSGSGCPDPALTCYLGSTAIVCECRGAKTEGASCIFPEDCTPGLSCLGYLGSFTCHKVCMNDQNCTAGQTCDTTSSVSGFGFCRAP